MLDDYKLTRGSALRIPNESWFQWECFTSIFLSICFLLFISLEENSAKTLTDNHVSQCSDWWGVILQTHLLFSWSRLQSYRWGGPHAMCTLADGQYGPLPSRAVVPRVLRNEQNLLAQDSQSSPCLPKDRGFWELLTGISHLLALESLPPLWHISTHKR